jgi:hypothetical protein
MRVEAKEDGLDAEFDRASEELDDQLDFLSTE